MINIISNIWIFSLPFRSSHTSRLKRCNPHRHAQGCHVCFLYLFILLFVPQAEIETLVHYITTQALQVAGGVEI
jgi:hypothetical protein